MKIIMLVVITCLSITAQNFSDGYSRMIKLGLFHAQDTLSRKDTLNIKDTVRVAREMILLKDL